MSNMKDSVIKTPRGHFFIDQYGKAWKLKPDGLGGYSNYLI